jgi:hypothetical protein
MNGEYDDLIKKPNIIRIKYVKIYLIRLMSPGNYMV